MTIGDYIVLIGVLIAGGYTFTGNFRIIDGIVLCGGVLYYFLRNDSYITHETRRDPDE